MEISALKGGSKIEENKVDIKHGELAFRSELCEKGGFVVSKDKKVITKTETINNIFYLSEELKKGVYKWAIEVENHPEK